MTLDTPKCLVKAGGEVVLEKWLQKTEAISCKACIVNTNYLAEKVEKYIEEREKINHENKNSERRKAIRHSRYINQKPKLSKGFNNSDGTRRQCYKYWASNLLNTYLTRVDILLTMLTFNTENPQECGIVIVDDKGKVINYKEKSEVSEGNIANGAVFVFGSELIEWVANNAPNAKDFCADIVPKL